MKLKHYAANCVVLLLIHSALIGGVIAQDAELSVVVGDQKANDAYTTVTLNHPLGVDFDAAGNMFIGELAGGRILRFGTDHRLEVIAGDGSESYRGDGGPAKNATFNGVHNVAVTPVGDIYISDAWNHCVRRIDAASGKIETFAGTGKAGFDGDNGPADEASFNYVMCVSLSPDFQRLYVADLKNRRVRVIDLATSRVRTVAGNGQKGVPTDGELAIESPLVDPRAVAVDRGGNVFVLERGGHALRVVRPDGRIHTVAGTGKKGNQDGPALEARFNSPKHLSIADSGEVYIADDGNNLIRVYDPATKSVRTIKSPETLRRPHGVCTRGDGSVFIVDSGQDRILKME